jgi:hypothetical protein
MVSEAATVPLGKLLHSEKGGEVMATADIVVSNADRLTANDRYAWTSTPTALPVSISLDLLGKRARALRPQPEE